MQDSRRFPWRLRGLLLGLVAPWLPFALAAGAGAAGPGDVLSAQRSAFRLAWQAIGEGRAAPEQDAAALRGYVLHPYLEAARLEHALAANGSQVPASLDQQIATFIDAGKQQPVAQRLRRAWLTSLAERGRWLDFILHHDDSRDGIALRCHGYTARIELGADAELAARIVETWLTPRSVPECERAFGWLADSGNLPAALVEQRVRMALEAGNGSFASQIAARLPAEQARSLLQWADLLENPRRAVDALIASPATPVEAEALHAGWMKLARADREAARQRLEPLIRARRLDARAASPLALALGLTLSWDRDPRALTYFAQVDAADFDDTAREWQARAALWARDWRQAARSIEAMSAESRDSARWRYWSARIAGQQGDDRRSRQLYESILTQDNYYSAMAAARLKRHIEPTLQPLPADAVLLADLERMPAFERARELLLAGLADHARAEFRLAQEGLAPAVSPQTIHLAARWGWYQHAVSLATGERVFNAYTLLYPRPFDRQVAAAARRTGLPDELIYGVIRQESLYQPDAVSSANARGLMQLTADTARRTARQWQLPVPTPTSLFEPDVNVALGAAHLKDLLERFDGQVPLALAGYNAGPNAARRWLPDAALDPDIWIENIPYNETRSYVQRILWHTVVFGWLRDGEPQDARAWLAPIKP